MFAEGVDDTLHIVKKVKTQTDRRRFLKNRSFGHFFLGWKKKPVPNHLRLLRVLAIT
jgi:hypothetical protein